MSSNSLPKVTVITIVLNALTVIERTLKSVVTQDYKNLEYLVVDGRSLDGTLDVIERYRGRITKIVSEPDGGIYEAMNKGAAMATGEWIIFMNGGDVFVDTDVVSKVFLNFSCSEFDVIYGDGIICHEGRRSVERSPNRVSFHDGNCFSHQSSFIRADVQREYGFDLAERVAADYDLFLRLYKNDKVFQRVDVIVSEFFTGGFSNLPPQETIRLRHRIYTKHIPRHSFVLYFRLGKMFAKTLLRNVIPAIIWDGIKRLRDRDKLLQNHQ